ncbi:aBC-type multidrug/protein/lipid transport system ATPase component [Clostridium sp. CAG:571]|jgi:ATP-binding cassette subfamily B multidrug efflux pump|nr:aBC-type multidrug/protein/lipid transport system ATPase component [Clostridium sp. CAG:571]HJJ06814.1 ABC transporter ATP-binding protein/permease [Clostridiaceae bacterium]
MKEKTLKRFKIMVKPYKKTIIIVTLMALFIDVCELVKPFLLEQVMDKYLPDKLYVYNGISIAAIVAFYIIIVIIGNIVDYINRITTNNMGEKVMYNLRNQLYKYIEKANVSFHDKTPSGKLYVRVTSDTEDVYALFSEVITTFPKDLIIIIGLLVMMVYISFQLATINILIIPLLLIVTITISKMLRKIFSRSKEFRTVLNTFLAESIYGIKLIKIFNRQKEKQEECEKNTKNHRESLKNIGILYGILPGMMNLIENIGISLIVLFCANKWLGINLDVGIVYLFITYLRKIFEPIDRIIENVEVVQDATSSIDKIYEILEHDEYLEDYDSGIKLEKVRGKIEFRNVWFAYEAENWILKDVSFTINPGESIALVGKTGSGKTTITNLINRFYTIQKGEILLDDININDINLKSLRKSIGTILQDPFIFAKSIKDNIKLYSNTSDEKIGEAVKLASATDFINSQNNGINEIAAERGNSYSAGQKQLIAFARIFAQDPLIFILDEATANIDTTTEELIQKSVDKISAKKTSIFIAHRLSTIVNVDKIIVLNKGKILEQGSHNELLQKDGYYAKLYNAYYNSLN